MSQIVRENSFKTPQQIVIGEVRKQKKGKEALTVTNTHVANKLLELGLVKDITDHTTALDLVQTTLISACNDSSGVLEYCRALRI